MSRSPRIAMLVLIGLLLSGLPMALAVESDRASAAQTAAATASTPVLEPSTLILVGLGLVGLSIWNARFRQEER